MRRVCFFFDYRDLHRVQRFEHLPQLVVRAPGGFKSAQVWQEAARQGDAAVHGLINDALLNTSVTVICIGARTAYNKHVGYVIERSLAQGNGIVGVLVHRIKDQTGAVDAEAPVPRGIPDAGFQVYPFTDTRSLLAHVEEAAEIAAARAG